MPGSLETTIAVGALALLAGSAFAQETVAPPRPTIEGRLFVRDTASQVDVPTAPWLNVVSIAVARVTVDYRREKKLRTVIELDFAEETVKAKDLYILVRPIEPLRLQAGHFKRPISPIALESIWRLPIVERGLLSDDIPIGDLYRIPQPLGGRSVGAQLSYEWKGPLDGAATFGVFSSLLAKPNNGVDPVVAEAERLFEDLYARVEVEPTKWLRVGASAGYVNRIALPGVLEHVPLGSVDAVVDLPFGTVWLEGFAGKSYLFDGVQASGTFWASRALVAPRFDHVLPWLWRVEPFAALSILDPTNRTRDNRALQWAVGVSAMFAPDWRVQLEYERTKHGDNYPVPDFTQTGRQVGYLQLGAAF